MTIKLYFGPGACSFVPHCLLEIAQAEFEPVMLKLHKGEQREAAFRQINPHGQVPVLIDGETVVTQLIAIVLYLEAKFPQAHFLPTELIQRSKALEILSWMNNTAHTTFAHIFMPQKFTVHEPSQIEIKNFAIEKYKEQLSELQAHVEHMQSIGQPWLSGAHIGPLDAYALTLFRWGTMAKITPSQHPLLWSYVQAVSEQPGVKRAIERERLQLDVSAKF
jgi:glutathione S-transferase